MAAEKARATHLEDDLAVRVQEVAKANDIIRRLQADLRAVKSKTKTRNTAIVQQERVLEEREEELRSLREEVDELRNKLTAAEEARKKERSRAAELDAKVEEVKRQLEDKQNGG